jgi:prefoldin subunit 5
MAQTATTTRKTAATKRSTTAKKAATTRKANAARSNARTTARKAQTGAQRTARRVDVPQTSAERVQAYAEKAVLIPVGAALAARESVLATADELATKYGSRTAAEQQLKAFRKDVERDLKKYERRGNTARNKVEREVKKTRTRVERELRNRRKAVEARTDLVTARAQNLVAGASKTGAGVAEQVTERVITLA